MNKQPEIQVWRSAIFDSNLPSTTKLVALAISQYAKLDGTSIRPSCQTVAEMCSLKHRQTAHKHVQALLEEGWLEKVRAFRGGSIEYRTCNPTVARTSEGVNCTVAPSQEGVALQLQGCNPTVAGGATPQLQGCNSTATQTSIEQGYRTSSELVLSKEKAKSFDRSLVDSLRTDTSETSKELSATSPQRGVEEPEPVITSQYSQYCDEAARLNARCTSCNTPVGQHGCKCPTMNTRTWQVPSKYKDQVTSRLLPFTISPQRGTNRPKGDKHSPAHNYQWA